MDIFFPVARQTYVGLLIADV